MDDDYDQRLEGAIKVIKGCLDLLVHNAKETLDIKGRKSFGGDMTYDHDIIALDYFEEANKATWTPDVRQMMTLFEPCQHFLSQYRERNLPVDTVFIKIGNEIIGRMIIPCI